MSEKKQIPIVCPGHTRPLAEVQFCQTGTTICDLYTPISVLHPLSHMLLFECVRVCLGKEDDRILLVSACHDRMPMMRDGKTGDWIGTWSGHKGAVWSCRLDKTSSLAATASGDFSARVWDAITGQCVWTYPHQHVVKACDFSPDSTRLATGGNEGLLRIYNLKKQEKQSEPVVPWEIPQDSTKPIAIGKLNWLSDEIVLTGCGDGAIRFWDLSQVSDATSAASLPPFQTLRTDDDGSEVRDMELTVTADGKNILTVAAGAKVYFFDVESFTLIHSYKMPIHFRDEGGASLHPTGKKFIAGGSDLWVRVFDFDTGAELECLKGHHGPIRCLRYSPNGKLYATGSEDGTIRLWQDATVGA
jgi:serine-threonine kinase receptor-associated protein